MRNLNAAANTAASKIQKLYRDATMLTSRERLEAEKRIKPIIAEAIRVDRRLIQASICEAANDKMLTDKEFIRKLAEILDIETDFEQKDWTPKEG